MLAGGRTEEGKIERSGAERDVKAKIGRGGQIRHQGKNVPLSQTTYSGNSGKLLLVGPKTEVCCVFQCMKP